MPKITAGQKILFTGAIFVIGIYFLFLGLYKSQEFLGPLVLAIVLALLVIPLANLIERTKLNRTISSLLVTIFLMIISLGVFALLSFQVKNFVNDWDQIKDEMEPKIEQAKSFIINNTGLTEEDIQEFQDENENELTATSKDQAATYAGTVFNFLSNFLLTFIYIFFLVNYRKKFKLFFLKLAKDGQKKETKEVLNETSTVVQQYLVGKAFLIVFLTILYSLGLGFSGVENYILISFIAAFLSLIPFIGNMIGFALALIFGFLTTGEISVLIGVIITFTIVQFLESYVFEPYIIGNKVNLHPFLVILSIILGNMVWGVLGMILAIPILGIINVIFDHIPPLKPFSYLLSNKEDDNKNSD